ncbi:MAG: ABC transporter permease [Rhodospirillales bacterium]|nr:MAG: ABC transporter permease [Rhodospirillales bacterium]
MTARKAPGRRTPDGEPGGDVPVSPGTAPRGRHIGWVNRIGLWTLFWRDLLRDLEIWKVTIAAPALQAVLFALIFELALGDASLTMAGLDFAAFLVPGLVAFAVLERGFESTAYMMVYDKLEGMITDVIGAPLTAAEMAVGFGLMAAVSAVITGIATWLALLPFLAAPPAAPGLLLLFAFGGGLMMGLVGLVGGLWADKWDHISAVQSFVVIPLVYMSGVFFSLDRLPDGLRAAAALNPVYYVIDGMRYGISGSAEADPGTGFAVMAATVAALWCLCWRLLASGYKLKP